MPNISVIVCSYNHAQWIERCIRSINHQDNIKQDEYEIIIVNDGSLDDTNKIVENLGVNNLRLITNEQNEGLPTSLNKAICLARGRFVVRVDSDDYVARNFLFLMKLFLELNREYQAVATDYVMVDEQERFLCKKNAMEDKIACGIMFRKECLFEIGLYNNAFKMREGHELRRRFEEKFKIARLEFPLYKYRQHSNNRTKNISALNEYDKKLESK